SGGRIALGYAADEEMVHLRVTDSGPGIPADSLDRIFEPFVQLDNGLTRKAEGAGLGLAISRRLARLMGGDLTVDSEVGKGSTFMLWLPADLTVRNVESASGATIAGQEVTVQREVEGLGNVGRVMLESIEALVDTI